MMDFIDGLNRAGEAELEKKLKQSMGVNQKIGEQNGAANQVSAPVSLTTALQKSPNESLGQSNELYTLVPDDKRDRAGPIVICARCLSLTHKTSISFEPAIIEPLDAIGSPEVNQAFISPSTATSLQNLEKSQDEAYGLKSSVAELVRDEPFPASTWANSVSSNYQRSILPKTATGNSLVPQFVHEMALPCCGCVTYNFQSNILPKPFNTGPCNACIHSSNNYVFLPAYLHPQQKPLLSMSHVNVMAKVGNGAVSFVHGEITDFGRGYSSLCEPAACDLTWNKLHSALLRCNLMEQQSHSALLRCNLMEQQSRSPLADKTSPLGQCGLDLKGDNEIPINAKADHHTGLEGGNVGMNFPTLCNQSCEDIEPLIISFPKCISIRADSHNRHVKVPNGGKNDVKLAFNTSGRDLLPVDQNKPSGYCRRGAPTVNEVQEQTKMVALTENLACLAFPQGMYKTEMCNKWLRSMGQYCPYGDKCQFAHGSLELRPVLRHRRYKTILCRMVAAGERCPYEHRCHFRHVIYPHEAEVLTLNAIPKSASSTFKCDYL